MAGADLHVFGGGPAQDGARLEPAIEAEILDFTPQCHRAAALRDVQVQQAAEARLRREAQALARLEHPNVVRVYDVGVAEHSVFVAMQLVDGTNLAEHVRVHKPALRDLLALFAAAGRGLAAAHEAGIVHRDVKPSNIFVDKRGEVFVILGGSGCGKKP